MLESANHSINSSLLNLEQSEDTVSISQPEISESFIKINPVNVDNYNRNNQNDDNLEITNFKIDMT